MNESGTNLTRRQLAVINGVIELYVRTGDPVASKHVVRHCRLGLSSATLRSVIAELEDLGYVRRPHPSAGVVPTDRSFRLYVDALAPRRSLPPRTRKILGERIAAMQRELLEDMEWVARLTAEVTNEAGVAVRPLDEGEPALEAVTLVPLGGERVLGVIVTSDGAIDKRVLSLDRPLSGKDLQETSNFLNLHLRGKTFAILLEEARDLDDEADREPIRRRAAEIALKLLESNPSEAEVLVVGTETLLGSTDFSDVERVRFLMQTLQDRSRFVREWRRALERHRTRVIIGHESEITASGNLGMVATLFFREGRRAGAVGVVGPRRMDYGRIVPVVEYIGDTLTKMLEEPGAGNA